MHCCMQGRWVNVVSKPTSESTQPDAGSIRRLLSSDCARLTTCWVSYWPQPSLNTTQVMMLGKLLCSCRILSSLEGLLSECLCQAHHLQSVSGHTTQQYPVHFEWSNSSGKEASLEAALVHSHVIGLSIHGS